MKSAKAVFLSSPSLDRPALAEGFDRPLGHTLEIVPASDPAAALAGQPMRIKVLYRNEPLAAARVSFIPRGVTLAEGFDDVYERRTDAHGECEWTPSEGNCVLIAVHHREPDEKGDGYDATQYAATLTLHAHQRGSD
jgi:uncharacterized GH25 family protein